MKKSKKIILSIVCIISVLVISSIPCFASEASNRVTISKEKWSEYTGHALLDTPTSIRMYSMGASTDRNSYHAIQNSPRYFLNDIEQFGSNLRLGVVLTFNDLVSYSYQPGVSLAVWERIPNTYSMYSSGVYSIDFDLYISDFDALAFPEFIGDLSLNGYRTVYTPSPEADKPPIFGLSDNDYTNVTDLPQIYDNSILGSSFEYVKRGSAPTIGQIYHCNLVVPVRDNTCQLDFSLHIPMLQNSHIIGNNLSFRITNFSCIHYDKPNDVPGFLYIPDFDNSFESIADTEEYFNDNLSDSLADFKDIGSEMTSFLKGDLLPAFAVWNQYFSDVIDIAPIRKLLIFSIVIGIFSFVVGATNLVLDAHTKFTIDKDK